MPKETLSQASARLVRRIDRLARVSDERGATTRTFLSPAMRRANTLVGGWMRGAGLSVRVDSVGNLIGRAQAGKKGKGTLLLGSHLDTVRDAGRFDGPLGVLLPLAAIEVLRGRGIFLPFAVEVLGFSEEEGVRFSSGYIGSKGYAGRLRKSDLRLRDGAGVSLGEVLARKNGGNFALPEGAHLRGDLLGYLEVHIEQGPVLESRRVSTGVVSAIVGQTRARVAFEGRAGHAGTTPMALRRDAVAGAAQFILEVEALARGTPSMVATVGRIAAFPGATNVIAGRTELSLDLRHAANATRRSALAALRKQGRRIARARGLSFSLEVTQDDGSVPCSRELTSLLAACVRRQQGSAPVLQSGAVQVPTTWAQFQTEAQALKAKDPGASLMNYDPSDPAFFEALAWQAGAQWFSTQSGASWNVNVDDAASQQVAAYWQGLVGKGLVSDLISSSPALTPAVANGQILTQIMAASSVSSLVTNFPKQAGEWAVAPLPTFTGTPSAGGYGGSSLALSANSKDAAAAAEFAQWYATSPDALKAKLGSNGPSIYPADSADASTAQSVFTANYGSYYPGQDLYTLFGQAAQSIPSTWTWGPLTTDLNSVLGTSEKQVLTGGTLGAALTSSQSQVVNDLSASGYAVSAPTPSS